MICAFIESAHVLASGAYGLGAPMAGERLRATPLGSCPWKLVHCAQKMSNRSPAAALVRIVVMLSWNLSSTNETVRHGYFCL